LVAVDRSPMTRNIIASWLEYIPQVAWRNLEPAEVAMLDLRLGTFRHAWHVNNFDGSVALFADYCPPDAVSRDAACR